MHSLLETKQPSHLSWGLKGLLIVALLILCARLTELTVIKGEYFRTLAEGNRIRRVSLTAPRGLILARGGEILAGNKEERKTVTFHPEEGYTKVPVAPNTPEDQVITEFQRTYPLGNIAGHITGYLGEVDESEAGKADPECLNKGVRPVGSLRGMSGLEAFYGCTLRGVNGEELVEVDIVGNKIRTVGRKMSEPGQNITTTIDAGLMQAVAREMDGVVGAAVATDGRGQVLALFSSPSFNPETFDIQKNPSEVQKLLTDEKLPLFNRSISGAYHPGSLFKLVTSAGALEGGSITKDFLYEDTGSVRVNEFLYTTWYFTQYGGVEGKINVIRALARSTDTFYYKIGEMMGVDTLVHWAKKFGVGEATGIDIPGEARGLLATPEWKLKTKGERWFLGNTYHMAIGQGDMTTTPLQANILTSVIVNGGSLCHPRLLFNSPQECNSLGMSPETVSTIQEGMKQACETGGTAFPFFDFNPKVLCKTGTAETNEEDVTHAWFTVAAPAENPEIVLTILVEKGGEGSKVAAPIARKVMDYWFHGR